MKATRISDVVKIMDIGSIKPYPGNPRKNAHAVKPVMASIREFGFKVPIIIDEGHTIIAGHTRLAAAKELGLSEVPVIVADDLTPEQVKAFRLADNKTAELATWDFDLLEVELGDITDIDMAEMGFVSWGDMDSDAPDKGDGSGEVDLTEYEDEAFAHTCPRCGYAFNDR